MSDVFCTIVSKLRAFQAIALFISMNNVMNEYSMHVLCVDESTFGLFEKMNFSHIKLVRVDELNDNKLNDIKKHRRLNEYCWTLKPVLIEKLFKDDPSIQRVTYVDADLFFWSDPSMIFENQANSSVLLSRGDIIIPMLPLQIIIFLQELMGNYNSGFISFKKDRSASDCLVWWKDRCLESCISKPEAGKFGDQKYLDDMPCKFNGVDDILTPGVNIGHWNNSNHMFGFAGGELFVDGNILYCYHFSGVRILENGSILRIHEENRTNMPFFYELYTDVLLDIINTVKNICPYFDGFSKADDLAVN